MTTLPRALRYLYPQYHRRRARHRTTPRVTWQANHAITRLLTAIGWTP